MPNQETVRFSPPHADQPTKMSALNSPDGEALAGLMIEHEVGVRTTQTIHVQKIDLDTYESDDVG